MDVRILDIKRRVKELVAARPLPAFSMDCAEELSHANSMFFDNPLMLRLQADALAFLNEACGLGVEHGKRVAIDAAAIVLAEPSDLSPDERRRLALLAEMAGLLHDSLRYEDDHAEKGADLCLRLLRGYPLESEERIWIARAVALHESPLHIAEDGPVGARLLAGAVHDADRFRFGPDIFSATLWELCECDEWPLEKIAQKFPEGPAMAARFKDSFRTVQGSSYGPALIDEGLAIAEGCRRLFAQALTDASPKA
jgi:hypothetical protein